MIETAIEPTEDQLKAFAERAADGPVHMLNLLSFRTAARYEDGRETALSGRDAYMLYGGPMTQMVAKAGGRLTFSALTAPLLVGQVDPRWEMVAIMTYPSSATLIEISQSPEYKAISVHRRAGLAGQLLIPCFAKDTFVG